MRDRRRFGAGDSRCLEIDLILVRSARGRGRAVRVADASASCPVLREPVRRGLELTHRACSSVGQSTRLISVGSVVQIYPGPPDLSRRGDTATGADFRVEFTAGCRRVGQVVRGISSAGRAPGLQPGGHRFEPGILHHRPGGWPLGGVCGRARRCGPNLRAPVSRPVFDN